MPKREVILNAALELFLEQGYERTSLKQIVARTGGSLATVYKLFGSKNQLFFEAIAHKHSSETAKLTAALEINKNLPLRAFLQLFGRKYLAFFASSENIYLLRLLVSAIYSEREIAEKIQREQKRILVIYLSEIFEQKLARPVAESGAGNESGAGGESGGGGEGICTFRPSGGGTGGAETADKSAATGVAENADFSRFCKRMAEYYFGLLHSAEFASLLFFAPQISPQTAENHAAAVCEFFLANKNIKEV